MLLQAQGTLNQRRSVGGCRKLNPAQVALQAQSAHLQISQVERFQLCQSLHNLVDAQIQRTSQLVRGNRTGSDE